MLTKIKALGNSSPLGEVLAGAFTAFALKLVGVSLAFAFNIALARLLGAEGVGLYFMALSVTVMGSVVSRAGLDNALLKKIAVSAHAGDLAEVRGLFSFSARLVACIAGILGGVGFLGCEWFAEELFQKPLLAEPMRWMSLAILPFAMINLQSAALKGLKKVRDAVCLQSLLVPAIGLVIIWPAAAAAGLIGVSWGYLISTAITALIGWRIWIRVNADHSSKKTHFGVAELCAGAKPLFVVSLMNAFQVWLPTLMLGIWVSAADVGIFGAATRIATILSFALLALNDVIAPKLAELHARGDLAALSELANRSTLALLLFSSPIFLAIFIYNDQVMGIFGAEFRSGGLVLAFLLAGQLVNVASGPVGFVLIMSGRERLNCRIVVVTTGLQILLMFALVPSLGPIGAALAAGIAMIVKNIFSISAIYLELGFIMAPSYVALIKCLRRIKR